MIIIPLRRPRDKPRECRKWRRDVWRDVVMTFDSFLFSGNASLYLNMLFITLPISFHFTVYLLFICINNEE